ncbi:hypothetical protein EII17_06420 [Clostridiales bacterium COT073_COT-073]|nr:hypothetical protein EII17_06420 [Clostridiales bacterium COT073_COT-073]
MKKFIGVTLIVAVVAMFGSIISFFVFDFVDIIDAQTRWHRSLGHRVVTETGELVGDIILDTIVDSIGESIEDSIDRNSNYIASRWESQLNQIGDEIEKAVNNAVKSDYNFQGIMDAIYPRILNEIGIKDGYITRQNIIDGHNQLIEEWTQPVGQIKSMVLSADNLNVVVGASTGSDFEFYITQHQRNSYAIEIGKEVKDETYYITASELKKSRTNRHCGSCILYILVPDQDQTNFKFEIINGNVVLINQRSDIAITMSNGNIIANQLQNHNFKADLTNGNIIVDLVSDLNAKVTLKIINGKAIGFGTKAILSDVKGVDYQETFADGKYEVDLSITNGNIIGN